MKLKIRENLVYILPVLGIRIRRIRIFLGYPNPLVIVRGADPDLHQNVTDPQHWTLQQLTSRRYFRNKVRVCHIHAGFGSGVKII
jgi:hypothetical protein